MGALLAAMVSINNPKVSGLVMMSTTLKYDGKASSPLQVLLPLIDIMPYLGRLFWWTEATLWLEGPTPAETDHKASRSRATRRTQTSVYFALTPARYANCTN